MKSGPTLKGWTLYFLQRAAIRPRAAVVFPTPLPVPAIRIAGVLVMSCHHLICKSISLMMYYNIKT